MKPDFKIIIAKEDDTPNICIENISDKSLFAKIWIRPDGWMEIRRFLKDRDVSCFIDKDGKVRHEILQNHTESVTKSH